MQGFYPKKLTGGHIIVGCDVATCGLVAAFLEEFFHEDHGYNGMHMVRSSQGRRRTAFCGLFIFPPHLQDKGPIFRNPQHS